MRKFFQVLSATALAIAAIASPKAAQALDLSGYVDTVGAYSYSAQDWAGHAGQTVSPGFIGAVDVGNGPSATPGVAGKDFTFAAAELKLHGNQEFGDVATAGFSVSFAGQNGTGAAVTTATAPGFSYDIQQAFVALQWDDVEFKMGRFYAPIGIESVDAPSRANVTMGNVFAGLEPFYLTGFQLTYGPEEGAGAFLWVSNDAFEGNVNGQVVTTDEDVAVGVGLTFAQDDLGVTLQYNVDWTAPAADSNFKDAYQLIDLSALMENDTMLAGVNANFSMINLGTVDAFITGAQVIGGVKMDDLTVGARLEYVYIVDDNGALAAAVRPIGTAGIGDGHTLSAAPFITYSVTDGVFARAEYRVDISDLDKVAFANPSTERSNQQVVSFELAASFE